jgi:hypothetical protein
MVLSQLDYVSGAALAFRSYWHADRLSFSGKLLKE